LPIKIRYLAIWLVPGKEIAGGKKSFHGEGKKGRKTLKNQVGSSRRGVDIDKNLLPLLLPLK